MISIYEQMQKYIIPKPQVQLCYDDLEYFLKLVGDNEIYYSFKIDGVRCWSVVENNGKVIHLSRNGKEFPNFQKFNEHLVQLAADLISRSKYYTYPIVFDSEVSSGDKKLMSVMTQLRRLNAIDTSIFIMNIFDIPHENLPFKMRHSILAEIMNNRPDSNFKVLEYVKLAKNDVNEVNKLASSATKKGYEGLVLTLANLRYIFGGRTRYCCKVKPFKTIDVKVVGILTGSEGEMLNKVTALIGEYKGKQIKIGSGFSMKERELFAKNPPIKKKIEIRYKEETPLGSLLEPRFIRMREDI